nr:hypothetical protein GCM10020063_091600 [Dactylosporangium thailandense]
MLSPCSATTNEFDPGASASLGAEAEQPAAVAERDHQNQTAPPISSATATIAAPKRPRVMASRLRHAEATDKGRFAPVDNSAETQHAFY